MLLTNNNQRLIIQVKNVLCIESNPHDCLPLLSFYDYDFKQSIHSARDKVILKDENGHKHDLPITNQRNGLHHINVSFIHPDTIITTSFNMVKINDILAAHERFL